MAPYTIYRLVCGVNSGIGILIGLRISAVVSCRHNVHVSHQRAFHHDSGPAAEAAETALRGGRFPPPERASRVAMTFVEASRCAAALRAQDSALWVAISWDDPVRAADVRALGWIVHVLDQSEVGLPVAQDSRLRGVAR
jgi:hypothetical protein